MDYKIFEQLLKMNKTTVYRVSKDTGIAASTLSDWKNGRSTPKTEKIRMIADYFGVSLEYMLGKAESAAVTQAPYAGNQPLGNVRNAVTSPAKLSIRHEVRARQGKKPPGVGGLMSECGAPCDEPASGNCSAEADASPDHLFSSLLGCCAGLSASSAPDAARASSEDMMRSASPVERIIRARR
jgi:transcriptional regulator with XRE-family HTH domain